MATSPVVQVHDVCASDPNFALIFAFCERFGNLCGVDIPTFQELQEMLEKTNEVPSALIDLHVKLLRKVKKSVHADKWERAIIKFCQTYSIPESWEVESYGYKGISTQLKLKILKNLLEAQFDSNVKFKAEINKLESSALRSQPLGWDKQGVAYWAQFDRSCNLRVYKEDIEEDTWNIVARDRSTLVNLINKLSGTNDKLLDEEVEDSNSIESMSEIVAELSPGLDQEKDESSSPISEKNGAVDFNVNNLENKTPNEFNVQTTNFQRKLNDESAQNYTANENLNDPIVGETVEESVMIIKGEGTGQECETGNPGENEPHEENNKADEVKKPKLWSIETICSSSKEVREEIIPVPKTGFFFGDDSVPCIPNIENENDASDKTEIKTLKETVDLNEKNESHDTNFDNLGTSNTLLNTDSDVVLDKVEDMPSKLIPKQSVFNITIHEKEIQITEQNSNEAFRNAEKCDVNTNYEISETDSLQRLSNDSERIKESTERESKIECNQPTEINIKIDNQLTDQNCSNANNTNIIDKVNSDQSNLQNTTKNIAVDISSQSTSSNNKTIEDKKILDIFILDNDKKLIDTVEQGKKIDIRKSKNIDGIIESSNVVSIIDESKTEENNQKIKNYIECVKVDNLIKPTDKIDSCDKTDISNLSKSNLNTNDQFIETKKELENISDQSYETVENKLHHYNKNLRADKEKTRSAKYEKIINCNAIETNKPLSFRHSDNEKSSSNNKCNKEANSEIKNEISELDYNNKHTIDNLLSNHDDNSQNTDNNYSLSSKLDKIYAERNQKTSEIKLVGQKSPIMNVCDKLEFSTDELEVENKNSSKDPIFDIVDKNSEITSLGNNNNNKKGKLKNDSSSAAQQEKDKPCSTVMCESNDKIKKIKVIEKEDSDETINEESTNFSKHKEDINLSVDCKNETDIKDSSIITTEKNDTATIPERMSMPEMPLKMGEQFEEKSHKTKEFNNIENPKKRKERKKELEDNTESVSVLTSSLEEEECHSVVNKFEDSDKHEKDIEKIDNKFNDDEQQADDNEEYEQKSEEDEELPKKITKPVGRKKRKRGKAKKIIVKKVNKDNEEEKVKKPRKPRQKKAIPLVEEIEIKPEENENQDNIRRSRRIAEIKIKEQVLPPDIYDNDEDSKSSMKKEKGRKKNIQIKKVANLIQSDDDDDEEESTINKKSKKKRKKGKTHNLKGLNKKNPWNVDSGSSSSDNNAEEFEDYYHEEEDEIPRPGIEPNISDHEFSPESDINEDDEEYLPEKRARTAHKKSQGEQIIDDMPCQNCNKSDHPDWILLCDTCNQGWHGSCLRPALMVIPDGDWYCPPCRHESLLNSLKATLKKFDSEAKKRENEELRRKRLAYVGISLQNVISTKIEDTKSKQHKNDATSEEEEDYDGEESEASDSNDSEPLYKLRARRQTNVSYRFNDYDDMINEAILEETGNEVTDVSKTYLQTKIAENENSDSENEFSKPEGSPIAPALLHLSRRRKSKKLTNWDISSDDDSDDDFKGPSEEEDEDEEEGSEYSDDSVRKRPQPTRRSVRSRRTVVDPDFINDDTSDESDIKKKKKRTREWSESEDSEEEDVTWGKRAKKRANVSSTFKLSKVSKRKRKANDNSKVPGRSKIQYGLESDSESDGKTLRKTRRKQITYAESDDSEEEIKPKRSKALSDDEDEYVLNDEELETEKDDINEDVDDIEDEELPNNDDEKEETSTTPVQRIPTPVKSPQQSVVPVQKAVTDELPLPDTSCDPPQRDIIGNQTTPNQRILPTQLVTADLVDNKKETVSSHSQKSPTAIDYSAYPYSPEKVAIPPPTLTYPVPPRLPVQGFVNKQVSSPVLPAPYTGYRNKTPINSPAPYGPIPQGQQVYHAPGSFSYPVEYGTTAALHHQQRPLPQGFEPALRNAVLPPTNEVLRGNDENPSSEFGGLVSYFSSQQEDDFDA